MLTADGPKLIEYNVRFGDPECEAIMPRIEGDFAALAAWRSRPARRSRRPALSDKIDDDRDRRRRTAIPARPRRGGAIDGIEAAERDRGVTVFHAGTARHASGALVASGGRVLAVTAIADTLANARARAYRGDRRDRLCRRLPPPRHRLARTGAERMNRGRDLHRRSGRDARLRRAVARPARRRRAARRRAPRRSRARRSIIMKCRGLGAARARPAVAAG